MALSTIKVLRKQHPPAQIIPYYSQMPYALSRYEKVMTPPDDVDSREVSSMLSLLDYLRSSDIPVEFQPINDIPGAFGAEIYFRSKKIAQIFVAENREGIIPNQFSIHCILNWDEPKFGDVFQIGSVLDQCLLKAT